MTQQAGRFRRDKVSQQVFDDLRTRIVAGEFLPGEKLPSETALTEWYGVSRATVRAALQKLDTLGQVETRVGEGTFVHGDGLTRLMTEVGAVVAQESMTPFIAELRDAVEGKAAELAAQRASDDELHEFLILANKLVELSESGDLEAYLAADYEFHLTLCRLSQNALFEMVWLSIGGLFKMAIRANLEETSRHHALDALTASAVRHVSLARSLLARDLTTALSEVEQIVNTTRLLNDAQTD